jgi:hypothetical protein
LQLKIHTLAKKHPGAFRLRTGYYSQKRDTTYPSNISTYPSSYYRHSSENAYFVRTGFQFNCHLNKLQLFYGTDAHFYYSKLYQDYFQSMDLMNDAYYTRFNERKFTQIQYGLIAIGGASYFLTPRISISFESNVSMIYGLQKNRERHYYKEFPKDDKNESNWMDHKTFTIKVIPISTINFNLHF